MIHSHSRFEESWPSKEYHHAIGLLLFATIAGLLFVIFHWVAGLVILALLFLVSRAVLYFLGGGVLAVFSQETELTCTQMFAVFFGTGAGILYSTPFGHSIACKNPTSSFPQIWQPYVSDCGRVMAISGLAWALCKSFTPQVRLPPVLTALVALSVIGLVLVIADTFHFRQKRNVIYEKHVEEGAETGVVKH
jgi:hypothetical protein